MQAFGLHTIAVMKDCKVADFERDVSDNLKGIEVIPYAKVSGDLGCSALRACHNQRLQPTARSQASLPKCSRLIRGDYILY
jgi:hypothetical protein